MGTKVNISLRYHNNSLLITPISPSSTFSIHSPAIQDPILKPRHRLSKYLHFYF